MTPSIRVFLDVRIGTKIDGRIVFELFNDVAPMAVENFRGLCTGEYGTAKKSGLPLSFKGCKFFKCISGCLVQSGDFEFNNGEGGESVYGGTFKDESFLRRHAQAGVLSMANKGRNSNGSQFIITLKRASQLDGNNVAFGQVIEGMDFLRAIEKCPCDGNHQPRVAIVITDCGVLEKTPAIRRSDPLVQMRESVAILMATLENQDSSAGTGQKVHRITDSHLGAQKIQQVLDEAKLGVSTLRKNDAVPKPAVEVVQEKRLSAKQQSQADEDDDELAQQQVKKRRIEEESQGGLEEEIEAELNLQDERQKKLYNLRLKLNQSRTLNAKEVSRETEERRQLDPNIQHLVNRSKLKETLIEFDRSMLKKAKPTEDDDEGSKDVSDDDDDANKRKKKERKVYYSQCETLNESAATIQWKDDCLKKKHSNAEKSFGWNALNIDSHYRAHKKRTQDLKLNPTAYAAQMLQLGEHFYNPTSVLVSAEFKPSEEAKERLAHEVENQNRKRKTFSRRRTYIEDENVGYINDYNRSFNKKLERAYGAQSAEIRQNLERGTAL